MLTSMTKMLMNWQNNRFLFNSYWLPNLFFFIVNPLVNLLVFAAIIYIFLLPNFDLCLDSCFDSRFDYYFDFNLDFYSRLDSCLTTCYTPILIKTRLIAEVKAVE